VIYFGAVPPPALPPATGSSLWQLIFISFGCVLILFEILRGWRRGMPRQLARLGAIMAAYLVAYFGGPLLGPWLRPLVQMPDAILSLLAGALLALLVYAVINGLGTMFFRRTSDHESAMVRLVYGAVGAVLGLFFGAFLVWLLVVSVRSLGAVADAKVRQQSAAQLASSSPRSLHPVDLRNGAINDSGDTMPLLTSLARLKNSLELGAVGTAVKKADVVPTKAYDTLGKVGKVCSDPETAQRFLSFPGARELGENARIVALREDPEIANLISEGRFFDLLQNQRILDAANDPEVVQRVKQFDLQGALDYAINRNQ
jgi:uncharacterized membrane protein required for colicin V production